MQAHNPNGISIDSAILAQFTAEYPYTLHYGLPLPLKIVHFHGRI